MEERQNLAFPGECTGGGGFGPVPNKQDNRGAWMVISAFLVVFILIGAIIALSLTSRPEIVLITIEDVSVLITIEDVSEMRRLEALEEVNYTYMTQKEFREQVYSMAEDGDFEDMRKMLESMFLWDPEDDLAEAYLSQYTSNVLGYYSLESRSMVLIGGGPSRRNRVPDNVTLVHEFTHALQDQHFNLSDYMAVEFSDAYFARKAVVEGDATMVTYDYIFSLSDKDFYEYLNSFSDYSVSMEYPVLHDIMMFPYIRGHEFVEFIYAINGWSGVNELYSNPPASAEQIMHVEKYLYNDLPIEVSYDVDIPGMELVIEDTLGEFLIFLMLSNHLNGEIAATAAEGWGGDRYYYYENDTDFLSILTIEWDTLYDATTFNNTCTLWMSRSPMAISQRDNTLRLKHEGGTTTIFHSSSPELIDMAW